MIKHLAFQKAILGWILGVIFTFLLVTPASASSLNLDSALVGKNQEERFTYLQDEVNKYNSTDLATRLLLSKEMLKSAQALSDKKKIASSYYELTYSYEIMGEYERAIEACFNGMRLFEELGNTRMVSMSYNELGLIYTELDNRRAIQYFKRFLEIQEELQDTTEIAGAYSNISFSYISLGIPDSALIYAQLSLELRMLIKQIRTIPISLSNVGASYFQLDEVDSAISYFQRAYDYHQDANNLYGMHEVMGGLVSYYSKIGDLENARKYAFQRFENSKKIQSRYVTKSAYYSLAQYYEQAGDYPKALENYKIYKAYSDSLTNESSTRQINDLHAVYDLDKAERELQLANKENRIKQLRLQFLIVGIIAIVLLAVVIIWYQLRKRRKDNEIFKIEREVHQKDKQLAASELEKSQMKEGELQREVEYKSKQLTTHALNMMKKNQFLHELEGTLADISKSKGDNVKDEIKKLNKLVKRNTKTENDWELFRMYFEEVNSGFYESLNQKFPSLSSNDYKLCALIKLNMNIKESASVLNISPESVKTARYRLRKKLNIDAEMDLHEFIQGL